MPVRFYDGEVLSVGAGRQALSVARHSMHGALPDRYEQGDWTNEFNDRVRAYLQPGMRILDVGGGRAPTIAIEDRPEGTHYVGLDLSAQEPASAPPGSYDEIIVSDISEYKASLADSFDLVISFQVLEHVRALAVALENVHRYLRPAGHLVAQFSGTLSLFGLGNRVLPQWAIQKVVNGLLPGRAYKTFPAYYDRCWHDAIEQLLEGWTHADIIPLYHGMGYFGFSRYVRATYLAWEEFAMSKEWVNFAPYYVVDAEG